MSENLDLVRSIFSALERGDFSDAAWAAADIEYVVVDGPEPATYTGLAGLAQAMRHVLKPWQRLEGHVDQYRELDAERVLVLVHLSGRAKASGLELDALSTQQAQVLHIHSGAVTRIVLYYDSERALADLGLGE